jgi:hypothetical protein
MCQFCLLCLVLNSPVFNTRDYIVHIMAVSYLKCSFPKWQRVSLVRQHSVVIGFLEGNEWILCWSFMNLCCIYHWRPVRFGGHFFVVISDLPWSRHAILLWWCCVWQNLQIIYVAQVSGALNWNSQKSAFQFPTFTLFSVRKLYSAWIWPHYILRPPAWVETCYFFDKFGLHALTFCIWFRQYI